MTSRSRRIETASFGSGITSFAFRNHAAFNSGAASGSDLIDWRIAESARLSTFRQSVFDPPVLVRRVDRAIELFPLVFSCFSRTDYPPAVPSPCILNDEYAPARLSGRNAALLTAILAVVRPLQVQTIENLGRISKSNAVLCKIEGPLLRVPLELQDPVYTFCVYRGGRPRVSTNLQRPARARG